MLGRDELHDAVIGAIPLHEHLGMRLAEEAFAVELPDLPQTRNHLGGQGGAALFAVAEAAGAAAVFDLLAPVRQRVFAVPAEAAIRFRKPARGGVVAQASLIGAPRQAVAVVLAGGEADLLLVVEVRDGRGTGVADLDARWHVAPLRPGGRSAVPRRSASRSPSPGSRPG